MWFEELNRTIYVNRFRLLVNIGTNVPICNWELRELNDTGLATDVFWCLSSCQALYMFPANLKTSNWKPNKVRRVMKVLSLLTHCYFHMLGCHEDYHSSVTHITASLTAHFNWNAMPSHYLSRMNYLHVSRASATLTEHFRKDKMT